MAKRQDSTNSHDLTEPYHPEFNPLNREEVMLNGQKGDIAQKSVVISVGTLVVSVLFLIGLVSGGTFAWFDLKSDVKNSLTQSLINGQNIGALRCDVFEIRNAMEQQLHKRPPLKTPKECL